ncbi:LuxR C-terminal-related transcriptional regulator [Spirillospora sp. NPDC046719]
MHTTADLLGRAAQEKVLAEVLAPGRRIGAAVAVAADPGMGASALLARAAVIGGRAGYRVLRAAGHHDEQAHEGAGAHQILKRLLDGLPDLQPARRSSARRLGVESATRPQTAPAEEMAILFAQAARHAPVLVVIDDLHLFDGLSLQVMDDLMKRLESLPVVFVLAARRHAAQDVLPGSAVRVELEELSEADAAALLARQPARPVGRGRLEVLRTAGGNPAAIIELSRIAATAGTDNLRRLPLRQIADLRQRYAAALGSLSPQVLRLVTYASLQIGGEDPAALLKATELAGPGWGHDVLDAAVRAGLLDVRGGHVVFCDPLAEVAVRTGLVAAERARIHRDFCAVVPHGSLVHALHQAAAATGPDEAAAAALENSARPARQEHPFLSTVALQWAAELSTDTVSAVQRRLKALRGAAALGQTAWARGLAASLAQATMTSEQAAPFNYDLALAVSRSGHQREAMDLLLNDVPNRPPRNRADALLLATAAGVIANASGLEDHRRRLPDLVRRARRLPPTPAGDDHPLASFDESALYAAVASGDGADVSPSGVTPPTATARGPVTSALLNAHAADRAGDLDLAVRLRLSALDGTRAAGTTAAAPEMWLPLLTDLLDLGRWSQAAALLDEADTVRARADLPLLHLELTAVRAVLAGLQGNADQARSLAESVWPILDLQQNARLHDPLARALGLAALERGEFDTAYRYFRRRFDRDGRARTPDHIGRALVDLAMTAVRAGEQDNAVAVLAGYRPPVGGNEPLHSAVHHATALLHEDEATERNYRQAVQDPPVAFGPWSQALARYHFGVWLRRQRRYRDARAQLKPAVAVLESLGAAGFAVKARAELQAAGDEPAGAAHPVDRAVRLSGLTPQQRQVAVLAAQGLGNKEIAARLLLSPRTVGTHLYNAYAKLGISNRSQLRAALGTAEMQLIG